MSPQALQLLHPGGLERGWWNQALPQPFFGDILGEASSGPSACRDSQPTKGVPTLQLSTDGRSWGFCERSQIFI